MSQRGQLSTMLPFKGEVKAFIDFTHKEILFELFHLFAISLKRDDGKRLDQGACLR